MNMEEKMETQNVLAFLIVIVLLLGGAAGCSSPTPVAPTPVPPTGVPPTAIPPTVARAAAVPTTAPTQAPTVPPTSAAPSYADAFAYCSAVGNVDVPDARYTGPKMPDAVLTALVKAAKISPDMPKDLLTQASFWRCMNSKVYACTVGANLPCQEKADTSKEPGAALNDFCKTNPSAASIPAAVTGRATVYDWKCVSGKPQVNKELFKADARGFIADFWYELAPATGTTPATGTAPAGGIANPASVNCVQQGGKVDIRKDATGGEVGYCVFPDKSECEEWAFMRGECKPGAKPAGPTTQVSKTDNGKTIQVAVGGTVVVTLEGNPGSTGYMWGLESGNDAVVKPVGDYKFTSTSNLPGASGKFEFKFTAASAGSATLKFANKRPWELNDPKADTFSVIVNVK
jgi:putative hemolysin/predicted secreted protein